MTVCYKCMHRQLFLTPLRIKRSVCLSLRPRKKKFQGYMELRVLSKLSLYCCGCYDHRANLFRFWENGSVAFYLDAWSPHQAWNLTCQYYRTTLWRDPREMRPVGSKEGTVILFIASSQWCIFCGTQLVFSHIHVSDKVKKKYIFPMKSTRNLVRYISREHVRYGRYYILL